METLKAGIQYGLSSQDTYYDDKELIFVKLTDSAQRAIDNYLRKQNSYNERPTIQFHGSKGKLFFPSDQSSIGNFTFSLSNHQDEKFECIHQTGPKSLDSLGILPCKMQIQANDDVYETTKHRLHIAKENNKNKCTRVLKTNEVMSKKGKSFRKSICQLNINRASKLQQSAISRTTPKLPPRSLISMKSSNTNSHLKISNSNKNKLRDVASKLLKERKKETEICKYDDKYYNLPSPDVEMIDNEDIVKVPMKQCEVKNLDHNFSLSFDDDIKGLIKELSNSYYGLEESDYSKDYTAIVNYEQRYRYKDEYSTAFNEYNRLQPLVYKITQHFSHLKEEFAKKQSCNDLEGCKVLERQIWMDYSETKNIKARHLHLHCKLEHIVKLINEFDSRVKKS